MVVEYQTEPSQDPVPAKLRQRTEPIPSWSFRKVVTGHPRVGTYSRSIALRLNAPLTPEGLLSVTASLARTLAGTVSSRWLRCQLEETNRPRSGGENRPGRDGRRHRRRPRPPRWSSVAAALEVYLLHQVQGRVGGGPGLRTGDTPGGARRTRNAVKSLLCRASSMLRPQGSGHTPRARQLGTHGRGPDQTVAVAGAACAWSRRM
jgi:hypothetical protein